jgi:hypothetical protein
MILSFSKGFRMDNHLMLGIDKGLTIISLNRPMGGHHIGRFVIRDIALDLFPKIDFPVVNITTLKSLFTEPQAICWHSTDLPASRRWKRHHLRTHAAHQNREPDISFIIDTGKKIARHLQRGTLVVLESTTYPGTTDEEVKPILETTGLTSPGDFLLAFSPEREDPGNPTFHTKIIPKGFL